MSREGFAGLCLDYAALQEAPGAGKSWVEEEEDKGLGWVRRQGWCEQT